VNETQQLLRDALNLLGPVGENWIQGSWAEKVDGRRCYCAVGAVDAAAGWTRDSTGAYRALNLAMSPERASIPLYNDHPGTTFDDIKRLFERAVERAGQEQ
jgi:hypothetical protein